MRGPVLAVVALATLQASAALQDRQRPFVERVEVARILVDARAFDDNGKPLAGLEAADFTVKIGGRPVRVESAEWIGAPAASPDDAAATPIGSVPGPTGRLVVFLVQRDLEPLRIRGLMQVGQLVDRLLATLTPQDRLAVVSFDSRLRFWTDFTNDRDRVRTILSSDVILRRPPAVTQSADVSLLSRLDRPSDSRIFSIEQALRRIGESLEPLPGAKTVVILGYGFGRFNGASGGVVLMDGYEEASAALQRARAAVFTLNVTQANFNSLQAGLQTVSEETGGLYTSLYEFPIRALDTIGRALAGHYVLFVEKPELRRGTHRIDVRLANRKGTVVARSSVVEPAR
jgi:VWFA-related protein